MYKNNCVYFYYTHNGIFTSRTAKSNFPKNCDSTKSPKLEKMNRGSIRVQNCVETVEKLKFRHLNIELRVKKSPNLGVFRQSRYTALYIMDLDYLTYLDDRLIQYNARLS